MSGTEKPRCRVCGSDDFILVGGFVVSDNGLPFKLHMQVSGLEKGDYALTRQLLQCRSCGRKTFLEDCENGAISKDAIRWEVTERNTRRPVICPKCSNHSHFVRSVVRAFTVSEYVKIESGEITEIETGDEAKVDEVVVRYDCNSQGCDGTIELRSADYRLTKG